MDTNNPDEVDHFVKSLGEAISKDMAEVRESSFDLTNEGTPINIAYWCSDGSESDVFEARMDHLGRLIFDGDPVWQFLTSVQFEGDEPVSVSRKEPRYAGDKVVAWVVYLDKPLLKVVEGEAHA